MGCGVFTLTIWWLEGSYEGPAVTRRRYWSAIAGSNSDGGCQRVSQGGIVNVRRKIRALQEGKYLGARITYVM